VASALSLAKAWILDMTKQSYLWVPEQFDSSNLLLDAQFANWFMHTLLMRIARTKTTRNGKRFALMDANHMRENFGHRVLERMIPRLVESGDVERVQNRNGTIGYRPGDRHIDRGLRKVSLTDPRVIERRTRTADKIERIVQQQQAGRRKPIHDNWEQWQEDGLTIDSRKAREAIKSLPSKSNPYGVQTLSVKWIRRRRFRFLVDAYGRCHNSISNIHSSVRQAIRIDGQPTANADIKASQPTFLANALVAAQAPRSTGGAGKRADPATRPGLCPLMRPTVWPVGGGLEPFCDAVFSGEFYELLASDAGMTVGEVKKPLLRDVFGKRGAYPASPLESAFTSRFPEVRRFIREFNAIHEDHGALLKWLQRIESDFVIGDVGSRLVEDGGFYLSLHDGIFSKPGGDANVVRAMDDAARDRGYGLRVKCMTAGGETEVIALGL